MQYKWTALTVTTVGTLMAGIESRILIIGLPTVAQQLHAGAAEVIWITQSFNLAATVCLLLIGRISDIYGRVKLYTIGFVIFTIGSLLSALSFNVYELNRFPSCPGSRCCHVRYDKWSDHRLMQVQGTSLELYSE